MDSDESQQPVVGESAGQQLRRAREKLGLGQSDIAESQHLRVSIIQFIEEADYGQIDSELFLKGYVRAYAKQVGADADQLIETLDQELEPLRQHKALQAEENPLVYIEQRRTKKRRIAKILAVIIILSGAAFAGWTYIVDPGLASQSETAEDLPPDTAAPADAVESDDQALETNSQNGVAAPDSDRDMAESLTGSTYSSDEVVEVVSPPSDEPAQPPVTADSPAGSIMSEPEQADLQPGPELAEPEPALEDRVASVAPQAELEMSFTADCWVQVTDSAGNRMVASLQRDGDRVNVAGSAPFTVVIGAVDAVENVSFSGEQVDISSFPITNNRAEFTLTL